MAKVLILGGGFAGVVAAERLAKELDDQHQITLVSRSHRFVFYPALVRLAFGKSEPDDVSFDLRHTLLNRRVTFIEAEVARINPDERKVLIAHGEVEGQLPYDYLIFALGRRLATERITGFYEHANHLLNVDKALQFGKAIAAFHNGRAVIGECPGARLPVPVYETAFALSRLLQERGERDQTKITIVSPNPPSTRLGDSAASLAINESLADHGIEFLPDFPINRIVPGAAMTANGNAINFDLLMLMPPFQGSPAGSHLGITNEESYLNVDGTMRVNGLERTYAVGDCVNFSGPKLGHMAVRQAEVAAANLIAGLEGREPTAQYVHEIKLVIDEGGSDSIYLHQNLSGDKAASVRQGRFWSWAKRVQEKYWETTHS
jgi:sulfide:quinone oxidoreductase